jgi:hypothetical protein
LDHKGIKDSKELLEATEPMELKETKEDKDSKELLEAMEPMELKETKEDKVLKAHLAHPI